MKKLIALVLALLMALTLVPAFAAEEAQNETNLIGDGANTISIAFDGESFNEEALFGVLQDFYEETGISVEVIYVASTGGWGGFFSKIQTMIAGGDAPDLIRVAIEGFQIFLQNTCLYFLMVEQNDFRYGMYFLGTYQCLEVHLIHAVCHCIVINLFDQCIVGLAVYFQHNLTSFVVRLQQLIYCLFRHLDRKRSFNLSSKQITCDIAFSS